VITRAMRITNVLQFFIILIVSMLIFPLSFMALGGDGGIMHGFQRLLTEAPPGYLSLNDVFTRPAFYIAYLVSTFIGYNAAWHIGQRYYSVPTERDARKMAMLCAVLSLILPFLWIAPTMVARLLWPSIGTLWPQLAEPAEASFVTLALTLLPNGLIGLTISAILAATMTSIDTQLNYLASILVRDVYVRVKTEAFHEAPGEREQLLMGRITAFSLGILAIITAIIVQRSKGVFDFALMYYSWFAPSMLMPVMLGFLIKKTPSWSAMASATAGLVVVMITNVFIDVAPYQYEVNIFGGVGIATLVFFLSRLLGETDATTPDRQARFAEDLSKPVNDEGLGWGANALASYRLVGLLTAAIGITVIGLALVPTSSEVRILTVTLGLGTAGFGGLMVWFFHRETDKQRVQAEHKGDAR